MKDKQGKEIDVGDVVEYMEPDDLSTKTSGVVTYVDEQNIVALWEDTKREQTVNTPYWVAVIKPAASIPAEPQDSTFTQEDEAMLQSLLKRKQEYANKTYKVKQRFQDSMNELSHKSSWDLSAYFSTRAQSERFIKVLSDYYGINKENNNAK